ncbi:MAG: MerR family transcriptional regulator, partial [Acidimicrobiales bacterium]
MPDRSHLSIGEVLSLLREEFPDVTISKIRFLESQGLVDPERTPSGYRKFYDHDVERLRWILRQQREHFLPLKVIKGRLADPDADDGEDADEGDLGAPVVAGVLSDRAGSPLASGASPALLQGATAPLGPTPDAQLARDPPLPAPAPASPVERIAASAPAPAAGS